MPKNIGHHARFKEKEHLFRHRAWLEGNFFRCVRARARLRALMTRTRVKNAVRMRVFPASGAYLPLKLYAITKQTRFWPRN